MSRQTLLRRLLIVGGVIVVLAIVAFGPIVLKNLTKPKPDPALATAEDRTFSVTATASGVLQPANLENVNFTISGQVQSIDVSVGEKVTTNQPLASLNDSNQQAELNAATYAVDAANAAIAQAEASGSSAQVSQARAQLAQAQVGFLKAQQDLAATTLRANAPGSVLAINGIPGDIVSAGNSGPTNPALSGGTTIANGFIVIGSNTSFELWAPFSQTEDVQLAVGQTAFVSVDAIPGLTLPAKVGTIWPSATQVGGVPEYYAEMQLSQSDPRLRNGQTGSVDVTVATASNVLAVPSIALFTGASGQSQVDVWSNGQAYATTVKTGLVGNTYTQITYGLQAGEQVVLSPAGVTQLPAASPSPS